MRECRVKSEARVQRWNSSLVMSRGKRFESARRLSSFYFGFFLHLLSEVSFSDTSLRVFP
jgi:hypothetical protein